MNKYTYSINGNTIYCMTYYAGKTIRGVAKCDPTDEFSEETGMKLAKARCDYKLAIKKVKNKQVRSEKAIDDFNKALKICSEAVESMIAAGELLRDLEASLS